VAANGIEKLVCGDELRGVYQPSYDTGFIFDRFAHPSNPAVFLKRSAYEGALATLTASIVAVIQRAGAGHDIGRFSVEGEWTFDLSGFKLGSIFGICRGIVAGMASHAARVRAQASTSGPSRASSQAFIIVSPDGAPC
jgi:hypothetical protein